MKEQQLSVNAMSGAELLTLNENEVSENAELNNVAAVERRTRAAEDVRRTKMKNEIKLVQGVKNERKNGNRTTEGSRRKRSDTAKGRDEETRRGRRAQNSSG